MFHAPSCAATAASLVDEVPLFSCEPFWRQSEEISPEDECNDPPPDGSSAVSMSSGGGGAADATSIIPTGMMLWRAAFDHYPPLGKALITRNWEGALALIAEGADVAEMDPGGRPPLHTACMCGRVEIVNAILGRFGDDDDARRKLVNQPEGDGPCMALHWAISEGHPECSLALIAAGSDLEARDFLGYTPLHLACCFGLADVASALVLRGANLWTEEPRAGRTPIESAIDERHSDCVGILVDAMERGSTACGQRRSCPACSEGTYSPLGLAIHHMMECPSPPPRVRKWVHCHLCQKRFKGAVGLALHELRSGDCGKTLSLPAPSKEGIGINCKTML